MTKDDECEDDKPGDQMYGNYTDEAITINTNFGVDDGEFPCEAVVGVQVPISLPLQCSMPATSSSNDDER